MKTNTSENIHIQPENFIQETTTAWSFPVRGNWATHNPKYRGNFAPQIPRNLILKYTKENDLVLDPMVGSGTTLIESKLLHRNAIGIDINFNAVELTKEALNFDFKTKSKQQVILGDARNIVNCKNESIDLVIIHPPYLNIVKYSDGKNKDDLSSISNLNLFCDEIERVSNELYRVLKPNGICSVLIGDTRKSQHYIPISYFVMQRFLNSGFILKEEIIKAQHNCMYSNRWTSKSNEYGFYLIMHEHLFVFRKPKLNDNLTNYKWSMKLK